MASSIRAATLTAIIIFGSYESCHGHGYLSSPRGRQFYGSANQEGKWWPQVGPHIYPPVTEPQSANRRRFGTVCGSIGGINGREFDYVSHSDGSPVQIDSISKFKPGQIIDIEAVFTAFHRGHMELKICNRASNLNQACFDALPVSWANPQDSRYPDRLYLDPILSDVMAECPPGSQCYGTIAHPVRASAQIPSGILCDHCLLQWHYVAANSCLPPGYTTAPWSVRQYFNNALSNCAKIPYTGDVGGGIYPEQFWNCADIAVCNSDGCGSGSAQAGSSRPPTNINSQCGSDTGTSCAEDAPCCSKYGWCGSSTDHCGTGCQSPFSYGESCDRSQVVASSSPPAATGSPPAPTNTKVGQCGSDTGNSCLQDAPCCSQYGWCGSSTDHCGAGCQSPFSYGESCDSSQSEPSSSPPATANGQCGSDSGTSCSQDAPCCSEYGWCGSSADHCGSACQSAFSYGGSCDSSASTSSPPTSTDGRCGTDFGTSCPEYDPCCSEYGWCGSGDDHCSNCQGPFSYGASCGLSLPGTSGIQSTGSAGASAALNTVTTSKGAELSNIKDAVKSNINAALSSPADEGISTSASPSPAQGTSSAIQAAKQSAAQVVQTAGNGIDIQAAANSIGELIAKGFTRSDIAGAIKARINGGSSQSGVSSAAAAVGSSSTQKAKQSAMQAAQAAANNARTASEPEGIAGGLSSMAGLRKALVSSKQAVSSAAQAAQQAAQSAANAAQVAASARGGMAGLKSKAQAAIDAVGEATAGARSAAANARNVIG